MEKQFCGQKSFANISYAKIEAYSSSYNLKIYVIVQGMVDCIYITVILLALIAILSLHDIAYYFVKFTYNFT